MEAAPRAGTKAKSEKEAAARFEFRWRALMKLFGMEPPDWKEEIPIETEMDLGYGAGRTMRRTWRTGLGGGRGVNVDLPPDACFRDREWALRQG